MHFLTFDECIHDKGSLQPKNRLYYTLLFSLYIYMCVCMSMRARMGERFS